MNFQNAVVSCLRKYATFEGRASRSEFWYFYLFCILASLVAAVLDGLRSNFDSDTASLILSLAIFVPFIAVAARRLHDLDKSGWWQLLLLIPLIGYLILIVWWATKGTEGGNRFGEDPLIKARL
jgi:uncharacterized membrane protein YhaH (DUF805 family)